MESRSPLPRLLEGHFPCILFAGLQNIGRGPPPAFGNLGEIPGVAFPTGEIAPGLIDGEIVFRPGKVNRRDQSERTVVCLFESRFAGRGFSFPAIHETTSLGIPLFDQVTFHLIPATGILSHEIPPLQGKMALWYRK